MIVTVASFFPEVRRLLRDNLVGLTHYSDETIANGVADGVRRLNALRPESRYVNGILDDPEFPAMAQELAAYSFHVEEKWMLGVVYYAAARTLEGESLDTVKLQLCNSFKQQADAVFAQ